MVAIPHLISALAADIKPIQVTGRMVLAICLFTCLKACTCVTGFSLGSPTNMIYMIYKKSAEESLSLNNGWVLSDAPCDQNPTLLCYLCMIWDIMSIR